MSTCLVTTSNKSKCNVNGKILFRFCFQIFLDPKDLKRKLCKEGSSFVKIWSISFKIYRELFYTNICTGSPLHLLSIHNYKCYSIIQMKLATGLEFREHFWFKNHFQESIWRKYLASNQIQRISRYEKDQSSFTFGSSRPLAFVLFQIWMREVSSK